MGRLLLVTCVFFSLFSYAHAGELYICVNSQGVKTIASEPQKGMKCKLTETFSEQTHEDIAKNEETKKQNAAKAERNKKNLDDCYEKVRKQLREVRDERCQARKLSPACTLPPEDAQKIEDAYQKANNKCAELSVN